jgi:NADPH:quinone reductase-like Zn-dependent oxidoreductase
VVAATGRQTRRDFSGCAKTIISREEADDHSGRPLQKGRWAGVVDTVGGNILATAIKSTKYGGLVAACGNTMSADLAVSVYPFILRGVSLLGVDSVEVPMNTRCTWQSLRRMEVDPSGFVSECALEELSPKIDLIEGRHSGRVVVDLSRVARERTRDFLRLTAYPWY